MRLCVRDNMESMNSEVRWRRWKDLGHILRKDSNDEGVICLTWAAEGRTKAWKVEEMLRKRDP